MKKRDLTTLAMIGITAGLVVGGCNQSGGKRDGNPPSRNKAAAAEQMSPDMQAFYSSLSPDAQKKFMQLDAQHKMMAIEMANQGCQGQNHCAGMGGCATQDHQCAGQNSCKGEGGAPVKDPNKAVETQYNNQMGQRQKTNSGFSGAQGGASRSPQQNGNPQNRYNNNGSNGSSY